MNDRRHSGGGPQPASPINWTVVLDHLEGEVLAAEETMARGRADEIAAWGRRADDWVPDRTAMTHYYGTDIFEGDFVEDYDVTQLKAVREVCDVPLVASGGAGAPEHFVNVFEKAGVDAALAASVFHSGAIAITDLKTTLAASGIEMRL